MAWKSAIYGKSAERFDKKAFPKNGSHKREDKGVKKKRGFKQGNNVTFKSVFSLQKQIDEQAKILRYLAQWCAELDNEKEAKKPPKKPLILCVLPKPCNGPKYDDWDVNDYFKKVMEEVGEVCEAYADFTLKNSPKKRKNFLRECTDVIVAITSLMNKAGADLNERQLLMNEVNNSNATRDNGKRFKKGA